MNGKKVFTMICNIKIKENESKENVSLKIKEKLKKNKVIVVKNGKKNIEFWDSCAKILGKLAPMEEDSIGNKTTSFYTDIKHPWHIESNSFSHSNTRQPLHTDGSYESNSPDIVFFHCEESCDFGGYTIFVSLNQLKKTLKFYKKDLYEKITKKNITHQKGNDKKTMPIISGNKINWNFYRCEECDIRSDFHDFLENYIVNAGIFKKVKLKKGDAIFFKDQEILHGRTSFLGNRWLIKGGIYEGF